MNLSYATILRLQSGIAIQGLMHEGDVTIFKCGSECLDEYYLAEGYMTENTNLSTSCRTQLKIKLNKPVSYFLTNPLGNHHILLQEAMPMRYKSSCNRIGVSHANEQINYQCKSFY